MNAPRLIRTVGRVGPRNGLRRMGGGHHEAPTSGPQHIHKHPMWELPFKKRTVFTIVWGGAGLGCALVMTAMSLQQYKAGKWFAGKKEESEE